MDIVKVTSIDELKVMSQGELVELPPFIAGQKFVARLRRPSMMGLIQKGKIPNNLLRAANSLFTNKVEEEADLDDAFLKDVLGIIDILADASFIEPTWTEIKEAGIEHYSLHSLRHTNIAMQIAAGVPLVTVSARAGHARTSTTTDIYAYVLKSSDKYAAEKISNAFDMGNKQKNETFEEQKAVEEFKQQIECEKRQTWIQDAYKDGKLLKGYELEENANDTDAVDLFWNISCHENFYLHTFIDMRQVEVK